MDNDLAMLYTYPYHSLCRGIYASERSKEADSRAVLAESGTHRRLLALERGNVQRRIWANGDRGQARPRPPHIVGTYTRFYSTVDRVFGLVRPAQMRQQDLRQSIPSFSRNASGQYARPRREKPYRPQVDLHNPLQARPRVYPRKYTMAFPRWLYVQNVCSLQSCEVSRSAGASTSTSYGVSW